MAMSESTKGLEERTTKFAVAVVEYVARLPRSTVGDVLGRQVLRSATSIGANYREANRSESRDDFVHKTALVEKEAAETEYWFEICRRTETGDARQVELLADEARQLLAIFTTINRKAKGR